MKEQILNILKQNLPVTDNNLNDVAEAIEKAISSDKSYTVGESAIGGDDAIGGGNFLADEDGSALTDEKGNKLSTE